MHEHAQENEAVSDDPTEIARADLTLGLALPWIGRLITQSGVAPLSGVAQRLSATPIGDLSRSEYEPEATPAALLLAGLIIDYGRAGRVSLGELLPGLTAAEGLPSVAVRGTRSRNVLLRMSANSWQAVGRLTPGQLQAQPNIGNKSVEEIVVVAIEEWANARTTTPTPLPDSDPAQSPADRRDETPAGEVLGALLPWLKGLATETSLSNTATVRPLQAMLSGELKKRGDLVPAPATTRLADLIAVHAHTETVPLGELFPGLSQVFGVPRSEVRDTRAHDCLKRTGTETWSQLAQLSVKDIQAWSYAGEKVLREILTASIEAWANSLIDPQPNARSLPASDCRRRKVFLAAQALARWAYEDQGAETVRELLQGLPPSDDAPEEIHDAWAIVRDAPLAGSTDQSAEWSKMPGETAIDRDLLAHRIYPVGKVRTLDVIGTAHDLTRERIRQLEKRLREQLALFFASDGAAGLRHLASKLRKEMGSLAYREDLPSEVISTWETAAEDSAGGLQARALLALAGTYSAQGPWIADRHVEGLFTELREQLLKDSNDGVVDPATLERLASTVGISERRAEDFAAALQLVPCKGKLIVWRGSQDDKGTRILRAAGEPLTRQRFIEVVNEITDLTGETVSEKGFFQRIQADVRVRRLGKDSYGLVEWGGEEYEGIITEMLQAIAANDGALPVGELAAMLEAKFDVSAHSVRMYSNGPQFTVDSDGIIREATVAPAGKAHRPLGLSKRCFRLEEGWAYRRVVDHDVLRGSGGGLPLAFATALKVPPGGSMRLRSPYGEIHASWPAHITHIGSLRPAALALGAVDGDRLFVVSIAEGEVDVRLVTCGECSSRTGLKRLAAECGHPDAQEPLTVVALALGLEDSDADLATAIRIRLAERGENDLLALMDDHGDDGDDLLDELASLGG